MVHFIPLSMYEFSSCGNFCFTNCTACFRISWLLDSSAARPKATSWTQVSFNTLLSWVKRCCEGRRLCEKRTITTPGISFTTVQSKTEINADKNFILLQHLNPKPRNTISKTRTLKTLKNYHWIISPIIYLLWYLCPAESVLHTFWWWSGLSTA